MSFVTTHASHPYSRILKTHVCSTLFFVSISIDLLFQTFSMAFSAAVAFASLVRTSLMLSRSYVLLLPRYVNCLTFSKYLPSMNNFPVGFFSPNTFCLCFFKVHVEPIPLALLIQCPCCFCQC